MVSREMYFEIVEVSTAKASGHLYVLVSFWPSKADHDAGDPPVLINDFLMQPRKDVTRIVEDAQGRLQRKDGSSVRPDDMVEQEIPLSEFELESFEKTDEDVQEWVVRKILAYWQRAQAQGYTGDHRTENTEPFFIGGKRQEIGVHVYERDNSDPRGILAKTTALRNQKRDERDIRNVRALDGKLSRDRRP